MKSKLDFLRLATWDTPEHNFMQSFLLQNIEGKWEQSKWLQYKGWKNKSVFVGQGEQKGERHCVVNVSGYRADEIYQKLIKCDVYYCTRLDVQITIKQPDNIHLDEVYQRVKDHTKASLIQSSENDTLYLGARESAIFTRLYEKVLDTKYLRLEFEIKGGRARAAWRAIRAGATTDNVFSHYLKSVKLPSDIKELFQLAEDGETDYAMTAEILKDDEKTLKWLQSIDGAFMKAMTNHNIGNEVLMMLAGWVAYAGNLDMWNEFE